MAEAQHPPSPKSPYQPQAGLIGINNFLFFRKLFDGVLENTRWKSGGRGSIVIPSFFVSFPVTEGNETRPLRLV